MTKFMRTVEKTKCFRGVVMTLSGDVEFCD